MVACLLGFLCAVFVGMIFFHQRLIPDIFGSAVMAPFGYFSHCSSQAISEEVTEMSQINRIATKGQAACKAIDNRSLEIRNGSLYRTRLPHVPARGSSLTCSPVSDLSHCGLPNKPAYLLPTMTNPRYPHSSALRQ